MDKEDLNRRFGSPEWQKPITPLDLVAAAYLIREHCNNIELCMKCIFHNDRFHICLLFEETPSEWELSDADNRALYWIKKQLPQGRVPYLDTDKYTDE